MAIISFTNYKRGQTTGCMGAVMRYTMQDKKTEFDGQRLVTGINCQPESVYADFMTTKRLYHKTDGVLFYHMVQSFPKGEAVDPVTAHAAALKLAEYYEGYEVLVCTHADREHIHSHLLINSVNFDITVTMAGAARTLNVPISSECWMILRRAKSMWSS